MSRTELEAVKARVRESAKRKGELESRMKAMKSRIRGIAENPLFKLLPGWIREAIEAMLEEGDTDGT